MFTRTTGWLIVPLWLAAMGWLVAHDVWPALSADEPPHLRATDWLKEEGRNAQFSILLDNVRIGSIWTEYVIGDTSMLREDLIWIRRLPIPITPLRIDVDSVFTADGVLDELTVTADNNDRRIRLHGERFHADFSFTFESGAIERAFKVPLIDGGLIAGALSPFSQLTDIQVGQAWRMQVFNPIAALTGIGDRFIPMLVEVTGEERITTPQGERKCLIVESPNAKAWVDERGVVLAQEMTLPMTGKFRIVREPDLDEDGKARVRNMSLGRQKTRVRNMPLGRRRPRRP